MSRQPDQTIAQYVTYTLEHEGRMVIIENVPARVDPETGEELFDPSTVERLMEMIGGGEAPDRYVETPVYRYQGKAG